MNDSTPEQLDTRRRLNDIAHAINERLPEGFGFICLVFPFGKDAAKGGRCNYVSNAKREDAINALKEWMIKCGADEDWMKHL